MIKTYKKMAVFFILAIFFVAIDRVLKIFVREMSEPFNILGNIFTFNFAKNYNIAFSIPFSGILLNVLVSIIIVILIFYFAILLKRKEVVPAGILTFLILGAISNLLDRLTYGYVIDYLDLKWFTVFNIADAMIVGGIVLFFISTWTSNKEMKDGKIDRRTI